MILKALAEYYERLLNDPDSGVAPPGFERKPIPYLIVLDKDGRFINIRDTRTGEGKKKTARDFIVPQGEKKTSGVKANLLWDTPQYVFGIPKSDKEKDRKRAADSQEQFLKRIADTFPNDIDDEGISAVRKFLQAKDFTPVFGHELWPEILETKANITFMLEGDTCLVPQRPQVMKHLGEIEDKGETGQPCSITGKADIPAELHPSIKGVWGAQSSGANIVSFNLDAFRSFGKKKGLNAPVGQKTTFAYTTALNTLLAKGSRQRIQVGDASTVFWAREQHEFEDDFSLFLGEPDKGREPDYGPLRSLLSAVRTGIPPGEDTTPFYVLGLAPNASRIAIRFWYEGSVRDLKEKIAQHFEDTDIIRAPHDREFLSLFQLLVATAAEGKADNIPPNLGGEVARSVLNGSVYPRTLLAGAIRRCKAEQKVNRVRAALIKAFLVREARIRKSKIKEVGKMLDTSNDNIGYVLGRLFAVLERIQEQAHSGLNKTIRDTYFSAATSSPLVIFKRLQELAVHHLAKIRNSGKSTVWLDKLMGEVMGKIPASGIPATLVLEDQGRFAVGYYHQRQDFFNTSKNSEEGE
ncbi:type I-C CRISPR-associated protein Cas8c/Csd1 [Desulfolithobacter dissulfuricans]|uniref:Type I-C CRISPR-associated protein Cas8c/Csd1 n=1 Tax=Desulfolithobacter dissulfuricans TaxID=2795293 RepID=A0A915U412_9BACT|nr:type I-C CRISPR-associated protein Cas8c/Csd1 [Desulfolithobacter dissulfuricans]BCO10500.1 type I-C CRISPR-associated protein Cas8c/Csd1 [Desulfolithobacter dissulfuricans]